MDHPSSTHRVDKKPQVIGFCSHNPDVAARTTGSKNNHVFSNWCIAQFTLDGKQYMSTEHRMMEQKALTFGDSSVAQTIVSPELNSPKVAEDFKLWCVIQKKVKDIGCLEFTGMLILDKEFHVNSMTLESSDISYSLIPNDIQLLNSKFGIFIPARMHITGVKLSICPFIFISTDIAV